MPTVNVYPDFFMELFGEKIEYKKLFDICFDYGIELEHGKDDDE